MAAASGLAVQWIHTTRERRNDINKIRSILKPEFEDLYQILIDEKQAVGNVKLRSEEDFDSLSNYKMGISEYFAIVGAGRLHSLAWNAIIASGNLIKLDNDEIEITQSVQHSVMQYNKSMDKLQKVVILLLEHTISGKPIPRVINLHGMGILDYYLDNYERAVDEAISRFNELEKLPWFDYGKIKSTATNNATT